jgi:hypothetical protein
MWSKELQELSREYFATGFCCVKSFYKDEFGDLKIEDGKYIVSLKENNKTYTYNSVDELINSGWAVD